MTLAEIQAYVGAPPANGEAQFERRDPFEVHGWRDSIAGECGWWYAITRRAGAHDVVVALGWTAGDWSDRDVEIARALAPRELIAEELAS